MSEEWVASLKQIQTSADDTLRSGARELGKGVLAVRDQLSTSYGFAVGAFDEFLVGHSGNVCRSSDGIMQIACAATLAQGYAHEAKQRAQQAEDVAVHRIKGKLI
jgi:hypothetical protein